MDLFEQIKRNVAIEGVVGNYTTLKRAGQYLKGKCPFHQERTPSFTVSPDKGIFYCFGCHAGGDAISFVARVENCTQKEAALLLADRYNIAIEESNAPHEYKKSHEEQKGRYFRVCSTISAWFEKQYGAEQTAINYMTTRGISPHTTKKYAIGYFPSRKGAIQNLIQYAHTNTILVSELLDAHILFVNDQHEYYSPFEERIIFPISDHLGRICGFGGRIFQPYDTRVKYYNTKENDFFSKGTLLFGFAQAKNTIQQKNSLFVVEGYIDCLALAEHGEQNSIATLGTACTDNHLKMLARYAEIIYFLYDGDKAGQDAILRIAEKCWKATVEPLIITLPSSHDPASYLQQYKTIEPLKRGARSIFSFYLQKAVQQFGTQSLQDKIESIKAFIRVLGNIDDPIKKNILLQKASEEFRIPLENLVHELKKGPSTGSANRLELNQNTAPSAPQVDKISSPVNHEQEENHAFEQRFIAALLQDHTRIASITPDIASHLSSEHAPLIALLFEHNSALAQNNAFLYETLWHKFSETQKKLISRALMKEEKKIDEVEWRFLLQQVRRHVLKKVIHFKKEQISEALKNNEGSRTSELLEQLVRIQKKMQE